VSALSGERLQERMQFCLHLHHEAGLGQLHSHPSHPSPADGLN
jgi:hypothetical protein